MHVNRTLWSITSKAALRSRKKKEKTTNLNELGTTPELKEALTIKVIVDRQEKSPVLLDH